jgi:hypothetical protein
VIANEAGGVVGAIVLSVRKIFWRLRDYHPPEEFQILQYFFSKEFSSEVGRLFSTDRNPLLPPEVRNYLSECFLKPARQPVLNEPNAQILNHLVKGGVLVESGSSYAFSSKLAKRFYIQKIFPTRAADVPRDLETLVKLSIEHMSASTLNMSVVDIKDFPKEAVFQHQFMAGLLASLPIDCYVCPELSKDFPDGKNESQKIEGEIDFYVNGSLRWGIELLVNGDQISEHISRFSEPYGKYAKLRPKDYIVVDFRSSKHGKPTNIKQMEKRMSVFFDKGDFSKCFYKYGFDKGIYMINLDS